MLKTLRNKILILLLTIVTAFGLFSGVVSAAEEYTMAISMGGRFIVNPEGVATLYGLVYGYIPGTDVQTQWKERPIADAKVEVFEGYLGLDEYDTNTPITVGYSNEIGEFFIEVDGVEGARPDFSIRITKDGEETVYSGAGSGTFIEEWPVVFQNTQDLTINVGDEFTNDMLLVDSPYYRFWGVEVNYPDWSIAGYGPICTFETTYDGVVDTTVPGNYEVTVRSTISLYYTARNGNQPTNVYIPSRIAEDVVTVTVKATHSTAHIYHVDEDNNEIGAKVEHAGKIDDEFELSPTTIDGYTFKHIEYPTHNTDKVNVFLNDHQDIYIVYTKDAVVEDKVTPPITGVTDNMVMYLGLSGISLLFLVNQKKLRKN